MSTKSWKELPFSLERANVQEEDNSSTSVNEEGSVPRKKRKCSPSYFMRNYSSDLISWEIFGLLQPDFVSQIHMIMAFSNRSALIVTKDKMVYGIGKNCGRLGINDMKDTLQPKKVEALCGKNIKTLCYNGYIVDPRVFALTEEGEVYLWGSNERDIIGLELELTKQIYLPNKVNINEEYIKEIVCSSKHVIVLTKDGKVITWGTNFDNKNMRLFNWPSGGLPWQVEHELRGKEVTYIACGELFNIAITNNGNIYSWGINNYGQLGIGNYANRVHPCLITSLVGVTIVKVVCGIAHVLALTAEGKLYSWGKNTEGQLGHGTKIGRVKPISVDLPEMEKVLDIGADNKRNISVAMNENKRFYVWGDCFQFGQEITIPTVTNFFNMYEILKYNLSYIINPLIGGEKSNILECLETTFDDVSMSDLIIQVEGQPIHVQKFILKIRSKYFQNMFQHNWMENNQNIIMHNQFSYMIYKAFLKYLYTGMIDLPSEKVLELLELADAYGETNLKRDCIQVIKRIVTSLNVAVVYEKAIKCNSKELETFCFQFAIYHLTHVVQTESFANLNETIKSDFLIKAAKTGAFKY